MTPRGKIFSLPADMPLELASAKIVDEQHSRDSGVSTRSAGRSTSSVWLYSKDVARLMHFRSVSQGSVGSSGSGITLRQVMRDVLVVPGDEADRGSAAGVSGAAAADCDRGG